jgi:hypothetical protein
MRRYVDRLRRSYVRNRSEVAQITACVLGLTIGIALGALSLGGHVQPAGAAHVHQAQPGLTSQAARG